MFVVAAWRKVATAPLVHPLPPTAPAPGPCLSSLGQGERERIKIELHDQLQGTNIRYFVMYFELKKIELTCIRRNRAN